MNAGPARRALHALADTARGIADVLRGDVPDLCCDCGREPCACLRPDGAEVAG